MVKWPVHDLGAKTALKLKRSQGTRSGCARERLQCTACAGQFLKLHSVYFLCVRAARGALQAFARSGAPKILVTLFFDALRGDFRG